MVDPEHVSARRLASLVRWVLWVEALIWAGVSVALVMSPGRWTATTGSGLVLAALLAAAAAAFAFVGMAVGWEPPRLVWMALLLALGAAARIPPPPSSMRGAQPWELSPLVRPQPRRCSA